MFEQKVSLQIIITWYGCPLEFVCDQGAQFINEVMMICRLTFCSNIGYLHLIIWCNGQVESTNKQLKRIISSTISTNRKDWDAKLHASLWAYQNI